MSSHVTPSAEADGVVAVDRTEDISPPSASPAPVTAALDVTHKVYCQGESCKTQWHPVALDPTKALHVKGSSKSYCASCFSKLPGKPEPSPVRRASAVSSFMYPNRDVKLHKYANIIKDSRDHVGFLSVIVIFWPLTWGYFAIKLRKLPLPAPSYAPGARDRLHWVMAAVSHLQCACCCAYIWFIYVAIVQSCYYGAQAWFWALLEVYTIYFLLLNIIYVASPIIPSAHEPNMRPSPNADPLKATINHKSFASGALMHRENALLVRLLQAVVLTIVPICGVGYVEHLFASLPNTYLVAKAGNDVDALIFTDADGQPLPENPAPGVFAARVNGHWLLRAYQVGLFVVIHLAVALNVWLMLSWVTHAWPSQRFFIPLDALIQLPSNVHYTVSGTMTDICHPTDDGAFLAVWNLVIKPTPSVTNGLPTLLLAFVSPTQEPVYFTDLAVGTLRLVAQDLYSMSVRPAINQHDVTLRASFRNVSTCSDMAALRVNATTSYTELSLRDRLADAPHGLAPLPMFFLVKYCFQMYVVAGIVGYSSLQILALWLQFDSLTRPPDDDDNAARPTKKTKSQKKHHVDLTLHQNLNVWYKLRCRVLKVVAVYTQFVSALMSIALVQLAVAVTGLVIYCVSGVAPLPGYYLLILTLLGSLSMLAFLLPLAKALDIQANHESMLHALLLRLHSERDKRETEDRLALVSCLTRLIEKVGYNDDRICFWGVELSTARLFGLAFSIGSGLSVVFSRKVGHSWSDPLHDT
ncbi:hypothetical protein SDRG_12225 [Saprolegnia diclina VS20]|uniref:Uncharacterized protein n=1 Tax=Saprolegnia diclina (strain VS20) TaxID=1156394 RepID=T0RCK9_SAPDV|nr:hypothetical protein SDRG_12225 [Saprolegnia diclina VS20]EQC29943.1 hypothetical protein SDRG_12225 [Saprolegnia diclina VS20]|eukprot:XP_008616510.1 hypothetical protein SDRG_12225 [Saprolegnia diclina VS20]